MIPCLLLSSVTRQHDENTFRAVILFQSTPAEPTQKIYFTKSVMLFSGLFLCSWSRTASLKRKQFFKKCHTSTIDILKERLELKVLPCSSYHTYKKWVLRSLFFDKALFLTKMNLGQVSSNHSICYQCYLEDKNVVEMRIKTIMTTFPYLSNTNKEKKRRKIKFLFFSNDENFTCIQLQDTHIVQWNLKSFSRKPFIRLF